ncbi:hypothetical protein KY289_000963 [Solanum tuberosum]|nr:hypothetical protein KY289_000963 [Solanum tuberosum]
MDAIIPALTHRIRLGLRKTTSLGQVMGALGGRRNDVVRTGDGGVGRIGVTGGFMRRCAWRLGRWGAG